MRALASYVMRGQMQAMTVVVVFAVLSLLLSPFSLLAGAAAGLVTLRNGSAQGAVVTFGGLVIASAFGYIVTGRADLAAAFFVSLSAALVPTWLLSWLLRATVSLGLTLSAAMGVGAFLVAAFYVTLGNPAAWWQELFTNAISVASDAGQLDQTPQALLDMMNRLAGSMTGILATGLSVGVVMSLFLARGWQALLYNPGGFKQEFCELRLGKGVAVVSLLIVTISTVGGSVLAQFATDLAWVVLGIYAIVGIAVLHSVAAAKQWPSAALIVIYVLMIIPYVVALVAFIGWLDTWVNLRAKGGGGGGGQGLSSPRE